MAPSTDDLRIPKLPVTVELDVAGEGTRRVEVFVAEHRAGSPTRQRVLDLLESEPLFIPVVDNGGHRLFNKATLVSVSIPLVKGALPIEEDRDGDLGSSNQGTLYDVRRPVTIELRGGAVLNGDLLYSPPPDQTRVVDYLNRGGRFLRLWCGDRVVLVNKTWLICVTESDQTQNPVSEKNEGR